MPLPQRCFANHPVTREVVIIDKGEDGYKLPHFKCKKQNVEDLNKSLGITPEVADEMLRRSMFGW